MHGRAGRGRDRDHLCATCAVGSRPAGQRRRVRHQHRLCLGGVGVARRAVRGRGRRAGGHRRDQQAAPGGAGRLLAVLPATPHHGDDVGVAELVARAEPRIDRHHSGRGLVGRGQPQWGEVVGVAQVVELGGQQHPRRVVEGGVGAEIQVVQLADVTEIHVVEIEAVEGQDLRDLVAVGFGPPTVRRASNPHHAWCHGRTRSKPVLGQTELSSYRDHTVIWTLGRYPL